MQRELNIDRSSHEEGVGYAIVKRDFSVPLAIIACITLLVLTMAVHFSVRSFDSASEAREKILAQNGISQRVAEVAQVLVPQTDWDDAVRNLDNHFSQDWAEANIGKFLYQTNGFNRIFVLDAGEVPLFSAINGIATEPSAYRPLAQQAKGLIANVRAQEARRGTLIASRAGSAMISRPIQASALRSVNGQLCVMTATLVQPDFGTALPKTAHAPIVLTTMPINEKFLTLFSHRFLLKNLHVLPAGAAIPSEAAGIPVKDESGHIISSFVWKPLDPGYSMLRSMIVPVLVVGTLLLLIAGWQLRQIMTLASILIARQDIGNGRPAT